MYSYRYLRVALLTLAPLLVAAGPMIWGSQAALDGMFNAPLTWISQQTPARAQFNEFLDQFGTIEFALVSWPGATLDDERLPQLADAIMAAQDDRAASGKPRLIEHVLTGPTLLRTLTEPPAEMSKRAALYRLYGTLVGRDGKTSCAVVALTEAGSFRRRETITHLLEIVEQELGFTRSEIRLAGPPVDGLAIDDESLESMHRYSAPAIVLSFVLCCLFLRSIWLTLPIMLVGGLGQAATLAVVYYSGITMNAVLIVLPPLVFVLTVSAGVHLVNYYYEDAPETESAQAAIARALAKARGPCFMAAITTAIGLLSLTISDVKPVRTFGAISAGSVLVTLVLLFLLLPGSMETRRALLVLLRRRGLVPRRLPLRWPRFDFSQSVGSLVWRASNWITVATFAGLLFLGAGLWWLRGTVNMISFLEPENRAVEDFRWFEENLGPLVPAEVVIHFDSTVDLDPLERLELIRAVQKRLVAMPEAAGWMSAATFLPDPPRRGSLRSTAQRAVMRKLISTNQQSLIDANYLRVDEQRESWRISGRIYAEEHFNYRQFLDQLREEVSPVLEDYAESGHVGLDATYTGVMSVLYEVEMSLLSDLFDSFLAALVLITIVMIFALRSFRAGLIAMVPNIFPTLIMFGSMGWLDHAVDIGTVMTASVALGIAVDGTFHFMKWFCHEVDLGKGRLEAIVYSYRHVGLALIQTTFICGFGLLVFGLSGFLPARYFSINLFLLLLLALFGDLVVLPALLAGPLGNVFARSRSAESVAAS